VQHPLRVPSFLKALAMSTMTATRRLFVPQAHELALMLFAAPVIADASPSDSALLSHAINQATQRLPIERAFFRHIAAFVINYASELHNNV